MAQFRMVTSCFDCTTFGMAQDHDDFGSKYLASKFKATYSIIAGYIACQPYYKKITKSLIKYEFNRHPAITTSQDGGKWKLSC